MLRVDPLTAEEKKELTNIMDKLKLSGKLSGQVVIHLNKGEVARTELRLML